jgi:hypothetical protein
MTRTPTATIPRPFGPEVTFFGVATGGSHVLTPAAMTNDPTPVPIYVRPQPYGFRIVLEGRRGTSGRPIDNCGVLDGQGRLIACTNDPRTGVQVQANRQLGDGSAEVCDTSRPNIGGVPGVNPPDFGPSDTITDILNDFACRFDDHNNMESACTFDDLGNFAFVKEDVTERQFCSAPSVGTEIELPSGETRFTAQLRDSDGNVGNQMQLIVRVP